MRRITAQEWEAVIVALNASLASPELDGFDDEREEAAMRRRMLSVSVKAHERREAASHERRRRAEAK